MNEFDPSHAESDDDELLRDRLARLRSVEPTSAARAANRAAIAAELQNAEAAERHLKSRPRAIAWWKRSIRVPVPLAGALLLLFAISLPMSVRAWQLERNAVVGEQIGAGDGAFEKRQDESGGVRAGEVAEIAERSAGGARFSVSEKYLCGVGRVSIQSWINQEYTP